MSAETPKPGNRVRLTMQDGTSVVGEYDLGDREPFVKSDDGETYFVDVPGRSVEQVHIDDDPVAKVAAALFRDDRLWVGFTVAYSHLGGPRDARWLAAVAAVRALRAHMSTDNPAAQPATVDDTALRERIVSLFPPKMFMAHRDNIADGVMTVVQPVLARKDAEVERLRTLLSSLVDPDDCRIVDGGCQAHGYRDLAPGEQCRIQAAKDMIASWPADAHWLDDPLLPSFWDPAPAAQPYESCVLDTDGHCLRPSHTHDATPAEKTAEGGDQ